MNFKIIASSLAILGLTACSTAGYKCPLTESGASCSSMNTAYNVATKAPPAYAGDTLIVAPKKDDKGSEWSFFGTAKADEPAQPTVAPDPTGFPQQNARGMPVWDPAKVHRAWVAPWVDADGSLHAGGQVYFTTPGKWNYGSLKAAGEASGVLEPVKPNQYGVNIAPQAKKPAQAPTASALPQPQAQPGANKAPEAKPKQVGTITQPYERLE